MFSSRVLSFFMFAASIEAFCPNSFSSRQNTAMHLKIEDGKELVAASQKVYRSLEDDDFFDDELFENDDTDDDRVVVTRGDAEVEPSLITAPRGMALAFVKRLFAQPTAAFHPNEAESLDEYSNDEGGDDVVYFPVRLYDSCDHPK